jgi:hypothetical protein
MKPAVSNYGNLCFGNASMSVWQWDPWLRGKKDGAYFVICNNMPLASMQGVNPGSMHVECIVDDFGNLVRAAA